MDIRGFDAKSPLGGLRLWIVVREVMYCIDPTLFFWTGAAWAGNDRGFGLQLRIKPG